MGVFGVDQQRAAGALQDAARLAAHGADHRLARCEDLEQLRRDERLEQRHVAQGNEAHVGGGVERRDLVLGDARAHLDVAQAAAITFGDEAGALGAVADEEEVDVGQERGGVEHRVEAVRDAVAADVRDGEGIAWRSASGRRGAVARAAAKNDVSAPFGITASLLTRNALGGERFGEGLRDHDDQRGPAVEEPCQSSQHPHAHRVRTHQAEADDGLGPQVAHLQHERHAADSGDQPRRERGEQRRRGRHHHVHLAEPRQAKQRPRSP